MQLTTRATDRRPSATRLRRGAGVAAVAVALFVGAAGCSSTDEPNAGATSTTAGADAGDGTTSTSTTTAVDDAGEVTGDSTTSSTGVTPAEHGPLPSVDLDESEQAYVDALLQEPPQNMDADQAGCIAGHWIKAVGVESVESAGVTPEGIADGTSSINDIPLTQETAEVVVDAYEVCEFDLVELVVTGFSGMVQGDPTKLACIETAVTPDVARRYMIAALMATESGTPDLAEIQKLIEPCLA
jgi:hypothetical protein